MKLNLKTTSRYSDITSLVIVGGISLALVGGWIANFVKLMTHPWDVTGEFILRIVGVFFIPVGSVLGFM